MFETRHEIQVLINKLVNYLLSIEIGGIIYYKQLSAEIGQSVQEPNGRNYLSRARRIVQKEHGRVLDTVHKVGLRRLNDQQIVSTTGAQYLKKGRKLIKKSVKRLDIVDRENLSDQDKRNYDSNMTILALNDIVLSKRNIKRINNMVNYKQRQLDRQESVQNLDQLCLELSLKNKK